jgi:hypothetical protein
VPGRQWEEKPGPCGGMPFAAAPIRAKNAL